MIYFISAVLGSSEETQACFSEDVTALARFAIAHVAFGHLTFLSLALPVFKSFRLLTSLSSLA